MNSSPIDSLLLVRAELSTPQSIVTGRAVRPSIAEREQSLDIKREDTFCHGTVTANGRIPSY
jgi:hypothetical protein